MILSKYHLILCVITKQSLRVGRVLGQLRYFHGVYYHDASCLNFIFKNQLLTTSFTVNIFQTIVGVVARFTIHRLNASAFSDFRRNANAVIISRLYRSTMFPFQQQVRRITRSSCKTPLLRIARIFVLTAAVNTPNKSAIWLCVSHTPVVVGRIVTCPFSIVMG